MTAIPDQPSAMLVSAPPRSRARAVAPALAVSYPTMHAARALAALAIVWIHVAEHQASLGISVFFRFGTPFFAAVSLFLLFSGAALKPGRAFGQFVRAKAARLYLPFLAWSSIYILAIMLKRLVITHQPMPPVGWSSFLVGTSSQLWFLPFLFTALILLFWPARWAARHRSLEPYIAAAMFLGAVALCFVPKLIPGWADDYTARFIDNSLTFLPAGLVGAALAIVYRRLPPTISRSPLLAAAGIAVTVGAVVTMSIVGLQTPLRVLAGTGWLLVALAPIRHNLLNGMSFLGRNGYGIFVSHCVFVESLQLLAHRGFRLPSSLGLDVLTWTLAIAMSVLACHFIRRFRFTSWMIP